MSVEQMMDRIAQEKGNAVEKRLWEEIGKSLTALNVEIRSGRIKRGQTDHEQIRTFEGMAIFLPTMFCQEDVPC